jgi:hypothetical protein
MMASSKAASGIKRPLSSTQDVTMCSFCGKARAAVSVEMKLTKRKAKPTPFCMSHYYTTSAVRHEPVTVLEQEVVNDQLQEGVQQVFAEAFLELQQELAHESARAFQKGDPLAIVGELRGKPKAKKAQAPQGGFMQKVPIPQRLLKAQQDQARVQREQMARMTAASCNPKEVNPYERRKPSRNNIWNLAMKEPTQEEAMVLANERHKVGDANESNRVSGITCACGSSRISTAGKISNRSSEMTKGETWGSKDRGESNISRYQCESCGRIWNQED